jgi:CBS domain-containing membrane protein
LRRDAIFYKHLAVQCLAALLFIYVVLRALDLVATSSLIWAAGASTLASSAYLVFVLPESPASKPVRVIGGYIVAVLCGHGFRMLGALTCSLFFTCNVVSVHIRVFEVIAAVSVGVSLIIMVLFKLEHPPAAGLALVMTLDIQNTGAMIVILGSAASLSLIRYFFYRQLRQLVH